MSLEFAPLLGPPRSSREPVAGFETPSVQRPRFPGDTVHHAANWAALRDLQAAHPHEFNTAANATPALASYMYDDRRDTRRTGIAADAYVDLSGDSTWLVFDKRNQYRWQETAGVRSAAVALIDTAPLGTPSEPADDTSEITALVEGMIESGLEHAVAGALDGPAAPSAPSAPSIPSIPSPPPPVSVPTSARQGNGGSDGLPACKGGAATTLSDSIESVMYYVRNPDRVQGTTFSEKAGFVLFQNGRYMFTFSCVFTLFALIVCTWLLVRSTRAPSPVAAHTHKACDSVQPALPPASAPEAEAVPAAGTMNMKGVMYVVTPMPTAVPALGISV